ncbi:MAG: Slp family lipoprotein [Betaproteobacteria bacterium]|nr:Slp family lipoprotein [Betaproteobacteria bacterium]
MRTWVPLSLVALSLAGCATVPTELSAGPFSDVTPHEAQLRHLTGLRVRWGGDIVSAMPGEHETCFDVVSRPLDGVARPESTDQTYGRFLGCAPGFYDPAVYARGRGVTMIGTLGTPVVRKIGKYDYTFPLLDAQVVHLWPIRVQYYYAPNYYGPWGPSWGPWGPWGPWPYGW